MSWNGAGVFNRIYSWVADKNAAINITASRMDTDTNDIVSNGFGNTLTRDGQGSASANLPMNTFRHTGVGNGVARTDYAALGQVEDGLINWAVATGTADAIAVSQSPNVTALADGQLSFFRATASNATTTPTYALNGLTARTITKTGGAALAVGDIPGNLAECIVRYNLANTRWELLNPAAGVVGPGSAVDGHLAVFSGVTGHIIKDGGAFSVAAAQLAGSAVPFGAIMVNGTIVQSQATNNQTFAIKTLAGADPSASDPVYFLFRDVAAGTGDYAVRTVTAALSITIPSGQAMGFTNATPARIWIGALDNAGTAELFVINALTGTNIYPLQGWGIISTSAVSGAASSGVAYSASARSNKAYVNLGYASWETGGTLGTAGTWNTSPTRLQIFQPGSVPLPGQDIQTLFSETGAVSTGTTVYTGGDTAPTSSQGNQFLSQAITPTSSANVLEIDMQMMGGPSAGGVVVNALQQDSTSAALAAIYPNAAANVSGVGRILHRLLAATLSATTFKGYAGGASGTYTFNGTGGTRLLGGTMNSFIKVREIMA